MKYKFVGDGVGVPGLPHEISDEEAEALGVTELLAAAIENGNYVVDTTPPPAHPQMSPSEQSESGDGRDEE